ncbi:hypothetical protein OU994_25190 [Pseudoduganella sp. SL102]|uniref:hypothetical protein n=1 Tax=Pseudoduganella sp. SL102 TaxID=2995154 RepID=UPI00248C0D5F|nr:hypothetical protein [Pseudoduganella sp. SL102]WBS01538.1 hypothetical protein OU994_25190 [Pseudoduganella sp. SL102]
MFSEFEDYLRQGFSISFWSNEGISEACGILNKFPVEDWGALAKRWRDNTDIWKVRCAETLDSQPSQIVLEILLDMLEEDDEKVVVAAADSLRSLSQGELKIPPATLERIVILRDRSGVAVKAVLSDFIKRITT